VGARGAEAEKALLASGCGLLALGFGEHLGRAFEVAEREPVCVRRELARDLPGEWDELGYW